MSAHKVMIVLGTRPEAIKLLPVITMLRGDERFETVVAHTGQHRELVDQIFAPFEIVPEIDLGIMEAGQTLNGIVSRAMPRLDRALESVRPGMVIVQGDTTSAFCAALAAYHRGIAAAHVEAGLRSGDRFHPYPEEVNRRMVSCAADLHLAPTRGAALNLHREGVDPASVIVTGNTVIDALLLALDHARAGGPRVRPVRPLVLVTLHRRESWQPARDDGSGVNPFEQVLLALRDVSRNHPEVDFLFPVHPNPRVRGLVRAVLGETSAVRCVEPLDYYRFVGAMAGASVILTDSGGIQEEAPSLGVPVLVVRSTTERPEGLVSGANVLVGTNAATIRVALEERLAHPATPPDVIPAPSPFGDGHAARRIRDALLHYFGAGPRPVEFE